MGPSRRRRKEDGSGSAAAVAHSELGVVRGREEEELKEQLLCYRDPRLLTEPEAGRGATGRRRWGPRPYRRWRGVAAWRGSMIIPGD